MTTRQRTYSRETWLRARDAWDVGGFSSEWADWRLLAARAGIIFPPDGDAYDSWGDDSPSQRAMLIRAIRETPDALRAAIRAPGVRSWSDVLERLLEARDGWRDGIEDRERSWLVEKALRRGAPVRIDSVLGTISDSLGRKAAV